MDTQPKTPDQEFEATMQAYGYRLREAPKIAGRVIKVYEKPQDPKYVPVAEPRNQLEERINKLLGIINQQLVLIDGFDKDHTASDSRATDIQRTTAGGDSVHRVERANRVEVPNDSAGAG